MLTRTDIYEFILREVRYTIVKPFSLCFFHVPSPYGMYIRVLSPVHTYPVCSMENDLTVASWRIEIKIVWITQWMYYLK